jgi:UDP:flavonoid glycosyltransferase YjiC (YdhE family)
VEFYLRGGDHETEEESRSGWSFWYDFSRAYGCGRKQALSARIEEAVRTGEIELVIADRLFALSYGVSFTQLRPLTPHVLLSTSLPNWDVASPSPPSPSLILCPCEFEVTKFRRLAENVRYVEPSVRPLLEDDLGSVSGMGGSRALVVASFGTQSTLHGEFAKRCEVVASVARQHPELQFVMAVGDARTRRTLPASWQDIPNLSVFPTIPQLEMLSRASLLLTHGGLGSLKEAILMGVPVVVCPMVFDQPFNAMRVRVHGIGEALFPEHFTAESLASAIVKVLSDASYKKNVTEFQRTFQRYEATPIAANFIHAYTMRHCAPGARIDLPLGSGDFGGTPLEGGGGSNGC